MENLEIREKEGKSTYPPTPALAEKLIEVVNWINAHEMQTQPTLLLAGPAPAPLPEYDGEWPANVTVSIQNTGPSGYTVHVRDERATTLPVAKEIAERIRVALIGGDSGGN